MSAIESQGQVHCSVGICEGDGVYFQHKFPKGLSLHSVSIEKGHNKPILSFTDGMASSPQVPTLTEEDVAVVMRLVEEGVRPEFFYKSIPPWHPFCGRQYKQYRPQWLRWTSVGYLLSETDWSMKCLCIGARSNDDKTRFWAWEETSKLKGLATSIDFPCEGSGSIIMSCKSVEVEETGDSLVFVGEPEMTIQDEGNPTYSDYITTHYDSVAYHDEPLFLKMKELIKLILAMEWLKGQGVKFNRTWIMNLTQEKKTASKAIEVVDSSFIENLLTQLSGMPTEGTHRVVGVLGPVNVRSKIVKTKTGIIIKVTKSAPDLPIKETTTIRISANDYDMVYKGIDPKLPVGVNSAGDPILPDVATWNEVFAETVPWPMMWMFPYDGEGVACAGGGVSTQSIPVREASTSKRSKEDESRQKGAKNQVPPKNVQPEQPVVQQNGENLYGYNDGVQCHSSTAQGTFNSEQSGVRILGEHTVTNTATNKVVSKRKLHGITLTPDPPYTCKSTKPKPPSTLPITSPQPASAPKDSPTSTSSHSDYFSFTGDQSSIGQYTPQELSPTSTDSGLCEIQSDEGSETEVEDQY